MQGLPYTSSKKEYIEQYLSEVAYMLMSLYPDYKLTSSMAKIIIYFKLRMSNGFVNYSNKEFIINLTEALGIPEGSVRSTISIMNTARLIARAKYGIYTLSLDFTIDVIKEFDNMIIVMKRNDGQTQNPTVTLAFDKLQSPNEQHTN